MIGGTSSIEPQTSTTTIINHVIIIRQSKKFYNFYFSPLNIQAFALPPHPYGRPGLSRDAAAIPGNSVEIKKATQMDCLNNVREGGLEPPHPYGRTHLKRMRLPFRHSRNYFKKRHKCKAVWVLRNPFPIELQKNIGVYSYATRRPQIPRAMARWKQGFSKFISKKRRVFKRERRVFGVKRRIFETFF